MQHDEGKAAPLASIALSEARVSAKAGDKGRAFELVWPKGRQLLAAESPAATADWLKALEGGVRAAREARDRGSAGEEACLVQGWLSRVRLGRTRRLFAKLHHTSLLYFNAPLAKASLSRASLFSLNIPFHDFPTRFLRRGQGTRKMCYLSEGGVQ